MPPVDGAEARRRCVHSDRRVPLWQAHQISWRSPRYCTVQLKCVQVAERARYSLRVFLMQQARAAAEAKNLGSCSVSGRRPWQRSPHRLRVPLQAGEQVAEHGINERCEGSEHAATEKNLNHSAAWWFVLRL